MCIFEFTERFYWSKRTSDFFALIFLKKLYIFFVNVWFRLSCYLFPINVKLDHSGSRVVVSFTSIPNRIFRVKYVVESLFRQTVLPDRIILYLSLKQFNNTKKILDIFRYDINRGLEIIFVDEDLGPHKKYFYAFQSFPYSKVITIDDDIFFSKDFIEELISEKFDGPVISNIQSDYWFTDAQSRSIKFSIPNGAGGVMYDLSKLSLTNILDRKSIIDTSLFQDDLWLYFNNVHNINKMLFKSSYKIIPIKSLSFFNKGVALTDMNVFAGGNNKAYLLIMNRLSLLKCLEPLKTRQKFGIG